MIARAESGQARDNMTEFDAAEIARGVGELYEPLADEKGLALKVEAPAPAPVRGNRELVSQALANLVDNAIKYAAPDGAAGQRRAGRDRGRGRRRGRPHPAHRRRSRARAFPRPTAARVVERFVRLEQSRSEPGSGLGLSLAAAVARLHGGELRLEDNAPGLKAVIAAAARRAGNCRSRRMQSAVDRRGDEARWLEPGERRREPAKPRDVALAAPMRRSSRAEGAQRASPTGSARSPRPRPARRSSAARGASDARRAACRHRRRLALSLGPCRRRSGALAARCSTPIPTRIFAALLAKRGAAVAATQDEAEAMRLLRRDEGGGRAADRARRHRRRLAGDAGRRAR